MWQILYVILSLFVTWKIVVHVIKHEGLSSADGDCWHVAIMLIGLPMFWPIALFMWGMSYIGCAVIKLARR